MSLQMLVLLFPLEFTNEKEKLSNIFSLKFCDINVPLGIVCFKTAFPKEFVCQIKIEIDMLTMLTVDCKRNNFCYHHVM